MAKKYYFYGLLGVLLFSSYLYFCDSRLEGELMWIIQKKSIGYKFYKVIYESRVDEIERNVSNNICFSDTTKNEKWIKSDSLSDLKSSYVFSDEHSVDIVNLSHDIFPIPNNEKDWFLSHYTNHYPLPILNDKLLNYAVSFENNGFNVLSDSLPNHWIYVYSKQEMPQKYAIEFDYYSETAICEQLQFDVFAHSLADRYRIISEYGERLFFDAVLKGYFLKRFYEKDCKIPARILNHIRLEVMEGRLNFFVNNIKELTVSFTSPPQPGHIIILFWNNLDTTPINIKISNFTVYI